MTRPVVRTLIAVAIAGVLLFVSVQLVGSHGSFPTVLDLDPVEVEEVLGSLDQADAGSCPRSLRRALETGLSLELPGDIATRKVLGKPNSWEVETLEMRWLMRHHDRHICIYDGFDTNSTVVAKWLLLIAFGFTLVATVVQYSFLNGKDGESLMWALSPSGRFLYSAILILLVGGVAVTSIKAEWMFEPVEWEWLYRFTPTWKNLVVLLVAGFFVKLDLDLARGKHVESFLWRADVAISLTILFSGIFLGVLGRHLISDEFLHAYNVGVLAFHMFLGVTLAGFAVEPEGNEGMKVKSARANER